MSRKITRGQLRSVTMQFAAGQGGVCALCRKPLDFSAKELNLRPVLDHNHVTGACRGALCRGCNGAEGRVVNAVGRWAGLGMANQVAIADWLEHLVKYLRQPPSDLIYHSHKSEDDKRAVRALAQKKRRAEQAARLAMKRGKE